MEKSNPIDYWYQKYLKERLTIDDVRFIVKTADSMIDEKVVMTNEDGEVVAETPPRWLASEEAYYTELLHRFNEKKDGKEV